MKKLLFLLAFFLFATTTFAQYIIDGNRYKRPSSNGSAIFTYINCSEDTAGNMVTGAPVNGVTQTISVNVTNAGTYNLTATANGVTFAGTGTVEIGNQIIVLTASGTPITLGDYNFTINTTPFCTFSRTTSAPNSTTNGTAVVSSYTCTTASAGNLIIGTPAFGVTQTITAEVTTAGSYVISATANGVTFLGTGTVAVGTQNIVLTATGTPAALATHNFTLNTTPNCSFSRETLAQVLVSGAVTGNGRYATLTAAFTAINGGAQTGRTISILVEGNTNETTTSASLNAGAWTSLAITPLGPRIITGATIAGSALINLNGADNVSINGLNTGGNSLTITNTTVSATTGTTTLRFINDASNNTITNCIIAGSSTLATSGTIFFSTGTSTGNDGNTISNCTITSAGLNLPVNAIFSAGTSTVIDNSGNTIHNNTIQDYFSPTLSSTGILLTSNSASWTITNNKLFQTATRTVTANNLIIRGILVVTASGGGYTINNNTIGFANASGTGAAVYNGAFNTLLRGVEFNANTTTVSNIQGNTIAGINFTSASNASTGFGVFCGIAIGSGSVNIGNTAGNTIGSSTALNSIVINNTINTTIRIVGIYVSTLSASSTIQNNVVGGISTDTGASSGYVFFGILTLGTGGNFTIINNTIGSTTLANSITIGDNNNTTGVCVGITNEATGTINIVSNTISNINSFGTGSNSSNVISNNSGSAVSINSNLIANASIRATGGSMTGISNSAVASTLSMNNNTIRDFSITNTTGSFTAISNSGAVTSSIAIDSNKLGDATGGLIIYTLASTGAFRGISNVAGAAASTLSIQNNDIRGILYLATASHQHNYIINSASTLSQNISGNTFTNLLVNTTGSVFIISNYVALPANGTQTINNNSIVTGFAKTVANGNVTIFNTGSTSNASGTIINSGNNFSNITVSGTSTITGWNQLDLGLTTKSISNNTFTNWRAGFATIIVMSLNGFGNTSSISDNMISYINGQGTIIGLNIGSAGTATALNVNNNTIMGLSSTGTGAAVTGLISSNNSTAINIFSNSINSLSSTAAAGTISGLSVSNATGGSISVYDNTINDLSGTGALATVASGVSITGASTNTVLVYKNKIYNIVQNGISTAGSVYGLDITGGINVTCYNNIISGLNAPNFSKGDAILGLRVSSTVANSNYKLYYNTVYLNATSTGVNFGAFGLYHLTNATATTANLILNNNIIINNSAAKGTGKVVAFQRSSASLVNYDVSSNNNLFYAGIPSGSNVLLGTFATDYLNLTTLQAFVFPRESNSVTENTTFLSTTPGNINYMKPDTTVPGLVESSGINIAGFSTDFDGIIRQGNPGSTSTGTATDLGAFEQEGLAVIKPIVVSGATSGNGNYSTLGSAFMAINLGVQTGTNIAISINDNTVETTGTAILNAGTWNSLTITPNGNRTISGAMVQGSPLINLNGADNVTIDGLNSGGNSLTLTNTTVSAIASTSTIQFINDASNNTITNCTITGSGILATAGTVFFSTGITTGNDGNIISNCAITPAGSNLPVNAIYSAGSSTAIDNSGNTIDNNTIQDYFSPTLSSAGIHLASNSATWTINNNKFFQTATRTVTANDLSIRGIFINTSSGGGYTINNNTIGFANAFGTGTTIYDGAVNTVYRGIQLNVTYSTVSNIQGNTVAGINFTAASSASSGFGIFSGIASSGFVNIGTTAGNTIGSSSALNSIVINNTSTTAVRITGLFVNSFLTNSTIQNNVVGGISTATGSTAGYDFRGILTFGSSNFTISNNTIGSTTLANSISIGINTTTSSLNIVGIYTEASATSSIDNNTVSNIAVFGTKDSNALGIQIFSSSVGTIYSNLIANVSNTGTRASRGIKVSDVTTVEVNNNTIRNFSLSSAVPNFNGLFVEGNLTQSVTINDNKLGDSIGGLATFTSATTGGVCYPIFNSAGSSTASLSIQNNDIRGIEFSALGNISSTYILNNKATLSQNISGNTFTDLNVNTNGDVVFISNNVALPANGTQTINNNSIVTGYAKTGTLGQVTIFHTDKVSNSNATITNSGNNFSNINIAGSSIMRGWHQGDIGGCTKTVSNNVFKNWTVGSGIVTGMWVEDNGINKTKVFNNTVDAIIAPDGIQGGFVLGLSGAISCFDNTITNLSATRTDISLRLDGILLLGRAATTSEPNKIYNNTVSGLFNAGGIGDNRTVGIGNENQGVAQDYVFAIYNNAISNISTSGTGNHQLFPLYLNGCKTGNAYNNKIYNISSNGSASPTLPAVVGISVATYPGGTWNVYNNLVSDLRAPNTFSTDNGVVGLYISDDISLDPQSGFCNFYYNTVYLNATSTVTDFGTSAVYHGNTGNILDMRNNILVNNSTATGTGKTTILMRSPSGTSYGTTYSANSNNNLFYAGVPSVSNNLLSPNGSNTTKTLTELKANLAPRESNTTSGAVSFLSLNGTSNDFLRPDFTNSTTSALINDKGTPTNLVSEDFVGVTRGTVPDIGAYEFFGTTSAVVTAYACNTASTGTMTKGVAVTGVTQTITVTVSTVGTYSISAVANGVTFAGTGTFAGIGEQNIVLTATGTPITDGTSEFTLNTTPNCSFSRTIQP